MKVKSFPKKSDGSKGNAERGGRIEKGDFLVAVNSIRLEGFPFNEAIQILTMQVGFVDRSELRKGEGGLFGFF